MSTTHIKDMRIYGVTCKKTGKPYFLLREQTFESNVFPQTPSWCSMYFGDWESLIRRVFIVAESVASNWGTRVGRSIKCNPMDVIRFLRSNVKNGITLLKPIHSISTCNGWGKLTEEHLQHFNQYLVVPAKPQNPI